MTSQPNTMVTSLLKKANINDSSPKIETLSGGLTNTNFKVSTIQGNFVVRVANTNLEELGILRDNERLFSEALFKLKLGPRVFFFDELGNSVVEFIEGRTITLEDAKQDKRMSEFGEALAKIHGIELPGLTKKCIFQEIKGYVNTVPGSNVSVPKNFDKIIETVEQIGSKKHAFGSCHNDLLIANIFLDKNERLVFIDAEYAGLSQTSFDQASLAVTFEMTCQEQESFLKGYSGSEISQAKALVNDMVYVYHIREATWSLMQATLNPTDSTYQQRANFYFSELNKIKR